MMQRCTKYVAFLRVIGDLSGANRYSVSTVPAERDDCDRGRTRAKNKNKRTGPLDAGAVLGGVLDNAAQEADDVRKRQRVVRRHLVERQHELQAI